MMVWLWLIPGWIILGVVVFASIDRDNEILNWLNEAPHPALRWTVLIAWPYFVYRIFK
jgi:hypothetical protein